MSGFYIIDSKFVCGAQPGTITAYVGSTDPPGWVIMDGTLRTNNSDGRYNRLAGLSIGNGGTGTENYTPPDYRNAFLRGTGTSNVYNGTTYAGASINTAQQARLENHAHGVNDPGHTHSTTHLYEVFNSVSATSYLSGGDGNSTQGTTVSNNTTGISVNLTGGAETRPYNYTVNWILKL
jgi:microcystin-dependent protein